MSTVDDSYAQRQSPARPDSPVSVAGEPLHGAGKREGVHAHTREHKSVKVLAGRGPVMYDPRLYKYDAIRGASGSLPFEVGKDDRMPALEAGAMLHRIHEKLGVASENEDVLHALDSAIWFYHTVNGGSTLVEGRGTFSVPGLTQQFSFADVRDMLGNDQRRFFRSFADDIKAVNKRVLMEYDPYDVLSAEKFAWLMQVAAARGLQRYPELAHDSADACKTLSPTERVALAESKRLVIASTVNSPDKMQANARTLDASSYNSSTKTGVFAANANA